MARCWSSASTSFPFPVGLNPIGLLDVDAQHGRIIGHRGRVVFRMHETSRTGGALGRHPGLKTHRVARPGRWCVPVVRRPSSSSVEPHLLRFGLRVERQDVLRRGPVALPHPFFVAEAIERARRARPRCGRWVCRSSRPPCRCSPATPPRARIRSPARRPSTPHGAAASSPR